MIRHFRLPLWGFALLLALCVVPATASAHAHLVRADLAPDSHVQVPAGTVHFWFDEALNSALSKIVIKNAQGVQVNTDTGHIDPTNAEELNVTIPTLPAGQYSVFWTSDSSQDGHILHGFYVFTAGGSGAVPLSSVAGGTISSPDPGLDSTAIAAALAHWLVLLTVTVWCGALGLELLVLARADAALSPDAAPVMARAARHSRLVARVGMLALLVASLLELESQAYQAAGWSGLLSQSVLQDILQSHYGVFWLMRMGCTLAALVVIGTVPLPPRRRTTTPAGPQQMVRLRVVARTWWRLALAAALGLATLLAVALSGHAAAVTQMVATSVVLDWLHLLASTVWIGGMMAIALALLPALGPYRDRDVPQWRAGCMAFLGLLDRFSPAAYLAAAVAAVTGMFNAQVHLSSLQQFVDTSYGRFLLIKLGLIAELLLLSASHVYFTRPRLRVLLGDATQALVLRDAYDNLALRLRIEPLIGALILLCVALMGQVAPAVTVFTTPTAGGSGTAVQAVPTATPVPPQKIHGTASSGVLQASLSISPAAVGHAAFVVTVKQRGVAVTNGQVRVKLSMPGQPSLGDSFVETTPTNGEYRGGGDLVQNGQWRADVLVRTRDDPSEFRDVPFDFLVGPGAAFLATSRESAAATITVTPGTLNGANTFVVSGVPARAVRLLSQSLDMDMGIVPLPAVSLGSGRWKVANAYAPMQGHWGLILQEQQGTGTSWVSVREFEYNVPLTGHMQLLSVGSAGSAPSALATTTKPNKLNEAYNVPFALSLPYIALVTEMGSNGVRRLGGPLLHTGTQAHGVDVLDGTPYAFVTNFGADPGTVTQIDMRTMRVVRTFTVGLGPAHIVFTPDKQEAFVTDFRSNDLYALNLRTGASTPILFPGGTCFEPHGIDISENGSTLYVACAGGAWIYTVDVKTRRPGRTVITGPGAYGVAVDGPRHEVWVTNQTSSSVSVVDERTLKVLATIPVGKGPALLVATPDGRTIYVADQAGGQVTVIDAATRKAIATLPVAAQPHGPDVTADGKYIYVASIGGNAVTIIRTSDQKVVAIIPSPAGSNEVAIAH